MIRKYWIVLLVLIALPGCGLIGQPIAEKVATVVIKYCTEPYSARQLYRETINAEMVLHGHVLHVHCAGDLE